MWSRLSDETTLPSLIFLTSHREKVQYKDGRMRRNTRNHECRWGQGDKAQRAAESERGNQRENARRKRSCESSQSSRPSAPGYQLQGHCKVLKVK